MSEYDLLTVTEVANYLRVSDNTIRAMIREGKLPALKVGREYRVKRANIDTALLVQGDKEKHNT